MGSEMCIRDRICNGQMSRDDALQQLETLPYDPHMEQEDNRYIAKKLGLSEQDFQDILTAQPKLYHDYPNNTVYLDFLKNPFLMRLAVVLRRLGILPKGFADRALATAASKEKI